MSRQDFATNWITYRDALLSRYSNLTDGDLSDAEGSTFRLAKRIATVQSMDPAEAQQDLHEFLEGPMPADGFAEPANDNAAIRSSEDYIPEGEDPLADDARFGDDDKTENPVGRDMSA